MSNWVLLRIVLHLAVADVGLLAGNFLVVVPLTVAGNDVIPEVVQVQTYRWLLLCFYGLLFSTFLIGFCRLAVFIMPNVYKVVFEGKITHLAGMIAWSLALAHTVARAYFVCVFKYDYNGFHLSIAHCSRNMSSVSRAFLQYFGWLSRYGPLVTFGLYAATVVYIVCYFKGSTSSASYKREINIMIQGSLICGVCMCATWGHWGSLQLVGNTCMAPVVFMLIYYLNSMINPIIFFLFNSEIRKSIRKLFGIGPSNSVRPVSLAWTNTTTRRPTNVT